MSIRQEQKEQSRQRILNIASQMLRERGLQGVSVAEVMAAAEMTHGGFYRHFVDRNDLVEQAIKSLLSRAYDDGPTDIGVFADEYLSMEHRDDTAGGCVFAALGADAARNEDAARHAMTEAMRRRIAGFEASTAVTTTAAPAQTRQVAIGSYATMVGALLLARIADDKVLAAEILDQAHAWIASGQPLGTQDTLKDPRSK